MSFVKQIVVITLLTFALPAFAQKVLIDGSHGETAGNADWIVDADTSDQYWDTYLCETGYYHHSAQRYPTPEQSGVTLSTDETYWDGGISAWGMDLAQDALDPARNRTWQIEQYPWDAPPFTYGDADNPRDLSSYDVLILCEPNVIFTSDEITAILDFVWNGGGLFMVADHETSDRNCSNGAGNEKHDSPYILNNLMGCSVNTVTTPPYYDPADPTNDYGVFGIWFYENGNDDSGDADNRAFDWFDESVNDNVETDSADPIIKGPFGDGSGGLGFFGATQMAVCTDSSKGNTTGKAHVWRNGQSHSPNSIGVYERVTFATAEYGGGRVAAIGDSSPADDGTGEGTLYDGWDKASGGVNNDIIHLNATEWIANPEPDTTAPVIETGPNASPSDCTAETTWTTDEDATSSVEWGPTTGLGNQTTEPGYRKNHSVTVSGLSPENTYYYRVSSEDYSGNGPAESATKSFTTASLAPLNITAGPSAGNVSHNSAAVSWTTDKPGDSIVYFGATAAMGTTVSDPAVVTSHSVELGGLTESTLYNYTVETNDACGQAAQSAQHTFTTEAAPAEKDVSGWTIYQYDSSRSFTFPADTAIPADGYLVLGRNAAQGDFEMEWGTLSLDVVYVNSGEICPMINGGESFELRDDTDTLIDGVTISMLSGDAVQRINPGDPAENSGSWNTVDKSSGNPGGGAGTLSNAGVVINEAADAVDYQNEFIELFYDAGGSPDTDPPVVISGPGASPGDCGASITWSTDEDSDSAVEYGILDPPDQSLADSTLVTFHSLSLSGLQTGTLYYYRAGSTDGSGNGPAWSATDTFTTTANAPVISGIGETDITVDSATVNWTTDENASRTVEYGTDTSYGMTAGAGTGTVHSVLLTGPASDTLYHYRVRSTDDCGLETVSGDNTFTTLPLDTTAPAAVTDLGVQPLGSGTVRLSWMAPGDDGGSGTAASYDIRCSSSRIDSETEFTAAAELTGEPAPAAAGNQEQWDVAGLNADSTYFFALKTADEIPNVSGLSISPGCTTAPEGAAGTADHAVISEVQTRGSTDHNDEFIELHNPASSPVSLSGRSIQYKSATGTSYSVFSLPSDDIPSHGYYLVARSVDYTGGVVPDAEYGAFLMGAGGGHVFLVDGISSLSSCTSASIIDKVGWGTADCPETAPAAAHIEGETIERKPGSDSPSCGNGRDGDDNGSDFLVSTPGDPQNSSMSESPCGSLGNVGLTFFMKGTGLEWGPAYGATGYKIRRSVSPDFMVTNPVPDDTYLLNQTTETSAFDNDLPVTGECCFYFINAVNDSEESGG